MSLVHTFNVGSLKCHTLEGGLQRLDGGAMFGVVPKPLWEREIKPDERNRIPLAMRCLLVEHPDGLVAAHVPERDVIPHALESYDALRRR